jgi:glycosyltransferase involved in cell wall biosynthesis
MHAPSIARRGERGDRDVVTVLYRGPFQGRRLGFLLESISRVHGEVDLTWLNPRLEPGATTGWFFEWVDEWWPFVARRSEVDGNLRSLPRVVRHLRRRLGRRPDVVYAIGSLTLPYARAIAPRAVAWCINGIPEERLLHDRGWRSQTAVRAEWLVTRAGRRPDVVVTVSGPMGKLIERRLPGTRWIKAPTCVDLETFRPPPNVARSRLTYVGSGAPWQCLDLLAAVWSELYRLDPGLRFRVISRDERTRVLAAALPASVVEMRGAEVPQEVATALWEAELGFLLRTPGIVNETSFPTKFGEYVAAGVPVVSTDVGWDLAAMVRGTGCGVIVDWRADPSVVAREALALRHRATRNGGDIRRACEEAAAMLARERWVEALALALRDELAHARRRAD